MSFPEYKDFDSSARDAHTEGYDTDYSLKVNSQGPCGLGLSTTTNYGPGVSVFPSTLSVAWKHKSGFAVDNLEIAGCNDIKVETSLKNLAPGLLIKYAGDKSGAGAVGAVYSHNLATVSADFDIASCSGLNVSALGGAKGFTAGASAGFGVGSKFEVRDYSAALGYAPKEGVFAGIQANNKLSEFNASLLYQIQPSISVSALVDYVPKATEGPVKVSVGTCADAAGCQVKLKANNDGLLNASVQRAFPKNLSLTAAAGVDAKNMQNYNFGLTATLG